MLVEADAVCARQHQASATTPRACELEPDQPPEGTAVRRLYESCSYDPGGPRPVENWIAWWTWSSSCAGRIWYSTTAS